jgi:hypothetical protein
LDTIGGKDIARVASGSKKKRNGKNENDHTPASLYRFRLALNLHRD